MAKFLYVTAPQRTRESMKMIDDHLKQFGACFRSSEGRPVQESDGTWLVRILAPASESFVRFTPASHYHLDIVREE